MKKLIMFLSTAVMAFTLTACGGSSNAPPVELELAEVETITITSADGTYTAEMPADWEELVPNEDVLMQALKSEPDGELIFFSLFAENKKESGVKFDTWKYGITSAFRKDRNLPVLSDEIKFEINGLPAVQRTINEGTENTDKMQMTFIDGETCYGLILCSGSSRETFDDNVGVFNVIVTSVKGF